MRLGEHVREVEVSVRMAFDLGVDGAEVAAVAELL